MAVPDAQSPRRARRSLTSENVPKSSGSGSKLHTRESHEDKESRRIHTHADPTVAINEMQPAAMALERGNLESLRNGVYKDVYGNPITEPDLSNPTRHRFERPLDTIRSFEVAIEGTYSTRRTSFSRADETSRRNSYFTDRGGGYQNRGYSDYNNRGNYSRPDSYYSENYAGPSYAAPGNYGNQPPRVPRHGSQMNSDPSYGYSQQQSYPQPGYYQGYDSGSGSGSGSHSADQLANYTDPSSVNSSMDGLQQAHIQGQRKPNEQALAETYGFNGFGPDPQLDYQPPGYMQSQNYSNPALAPAVPPKNDVNRLSRNGPTQHVVRKPAPTPSSPTKEKRKSFFKRFSKG